MSLCVHVFVQECVSVWVMVPTSMDDAHTHSLTLNAAQFSEFYPWHGRKTPPFVKLVMDDITHSAPIGALQ